MKKIFTPMLAVAMAIICSCNSQTNNNETTDNQENKTRNIESVKQTENKQQPNFLTQDLRMHNFFGKVKDYETLINDVDANRNPLPNTSAYQDFCTIKYDSDGHFVDFITEFYTVDQVTRKDGDKIIEAERLIEEYNIKIKTIFTYNAQNQLETYKTKGPESESDTKYFYNNDGELIKTVENSSGEGMIYKLEIIYTILERDVNKNWTKRFVEYKTQTKPIDNSADFKDEAPRYEIQTRTINYY